MAALIGATYSYSSSNPKKTFTDWMLEHEKKLKPWDDLCAVSYTNATVPEKKESSQASDQGSAIASEDPNKSTEETSRSAPVSHNGGSAHVFPNFMEQYSKSLSIRKEPKQKTKGLPSPDMVQTEALPEAPAEQPGTLQYDLESFNKVVGKISNEVARKNFEEMSTKPAIIGEHGNNLKRMKGTTKPPIFELRWVNSESRMFFVKYDDTFHALSHTNSHYVPNKTLQEQAKRKQQELDSKKNLNKARGIS